MNLHAPNVCLSFVLLFTIFIIVVTQRKVRLGVDIFNKRILDSCISSSETTVLQNTASSMAMTLQLKKGRLYQLKGQTGYVR